MKIRNLKFVTLLILIMAIFTGCQSKAENLVLTGSVEGKSVDVLARTAGEITGMFVSEGQVVKVNQALAQLDDRELKLKKVNLEIIRQISELKYEDLKNGNSKASVRQAIANRDLVQSQVAGVQKEIDYLKNQLSDAKSLAESGATAENQTEEIQRALDQQNAKMAALVDQQKVAQEGLNIVLEGAVTEQLKQALLDIQLKSNELDQLGLALEKTKIDAPCSGSIQTVNYSVGEYVNQGQKLFSMIDLSELTLKVYVNGKNLALIKEGMSVTVSGDYKAEQPVKGAISFIADEAEFTPKNIESKESKQEMVYEVHILIDDPNGIVKPGMYLDADFGVLRNE